MIKTIPLPLIKIRPNRQRREFKEDDLRSLADSITTNGLFHPITLSVEGDDFYLVSGERRLRAITDIFGLGGAFKCDGVELRDGVVPFVTLGELTPLEREEAEWEENNRRVDLTWQEKATATARLMDLRQRQFDVGKGDKPSVATITQEIKGATHGSYHEDTRREIIVSQHFDKPEVKEAKSLDEAWKNLKRTEEREKNQILAAKVGAVFTADVHRAFNADAREWLKQQSAERYDVILTDPPYGMGADQFGDAGGLAQGAHGYKDTREYFEDLMQVFCYHSFRIAKQQAHAYVFCDIDNYFDLRMWMTEAGWTCFRTPMIWFKPGAMRAPWPHSGPYRRYETILYAKKGDRPVQKLYPDVLQHNADENQGHAAQKPVELFIDLLRRSVRPGDSVLDPFSGTGTIFPAAHSLKCSATGVELDAGSYGIGVKRIEGLKAQKEPVL